MTLLRWRFLTGLTAGILVVFAAKFVINETSVADWIVAPLLVPDVAGPADAIVVLGAGVIGDCVPNTHSLRRVLHGVRRWREQSAPILLFSGGTGEPCPVAEAMAQTAREFGVPAPNVRVETVSTNTHENAELSTALLWGWRAPRLLLVTDRLHMRRASATFSRPGFEIRRASVPIYEGHEDNMSMLGAGLREFAALTYYRIRGWLTPSAAQGTMNTPTNSAAPLPPKHTEGPIVVLGASYAAGLPLKRVGGIPVVNRGIAGQESSDLLERFDRDVASERPRAVILWGFINDIVRAPMDQVDAVAERIRSNYGRMIERSRELRITPILATEVTIGPPPGLLNLVADWVGAIRGKDAYQDRINRHVLAMDRWLVELASREGLLLLDLQAVLAQPGGRRRTAFTQPDGSHITARGYEMLTTYAGPVLEEFLRVR